MLPSSGHRRRQPVGCIVLQRLYSAQKLETLHECMLRLTCHAPEAHVTLQQGLLQPSDPPSYRELLTNGVVFMSAAAPALPAHLTLQQACSQAEVVLRAVDVLVRTGQESNMLRHGYRKKRPGSGFGAGAFVAGLQHAEPWALNSTTMAVATCPEWGLLLSRAGDVLVLHLLLHGSLFAPLGTGNFLQLCGRSVSEVARAANQASIARGRHGQAAPAAQPGSTSAAAPTPAGQPPQQAAPRNESARELAQGITESAGRPQASARPRQSAAAAAAVTSAVAPTRPPSWQRRKAALARPQQQQQQLQQQRQDAQQASAQQGSEHTEMVVDDGVGGESWQLESQATPCVHPAQDEDETRVFRDYETDEQGLWQEAMASQMFARSPLALWDFSQHQGHAGGWSIAGTALSPAHAAPFSPPPDDMLPTPMRLAAAGQEAGQASDDEVADGVVAGLAGVGVGGTRPAGSPSAARGHVQGGRQASGQVRRTRGPPPKRPPTLHGAGPLVQGTAAAAAGAAAGAQPAMGVGGLPRAGTGASSLHTAGMAYAAPTASQLTKPSARVLPRTTIFYCATFPRKPGLPAHHLLSRLVPGRRGARALCRSIFHAQTPVRPPHPFAGTMQGGNAPGAPGTAPHMAMGAALAPPQPLLPTTAQPPGGQAVAAAPAAAGVRGVRGGACTRAHDAAAAGRGVELPLCAEGGREAAQGSSDPRRLPPRLRPMLRALKNMIARVRRCPYGILLNKHCPLPPHMARTPPQPPPAAVVRAAGVGVGGLGGGLPSSTARQAGALAALVQVHTTVVHQHTAAGREASEQAPEPQAAARMPLPSFLKRRKLAGAGPTVSASAAARAEGTGAAAAVDVLRPPTGSSASTRAVPSGVLGAGAAAGPPSQAHESAREAREEEQQLAEGSCRHMGQLLSGCSPHTAVASFLWSVVRHIVPPTLLGNRHNRGVLLRVLRAFVSLRRHEHLTLHQATQGLRTSGFTWLSPPTPALAPGQVPRSLHLARSRALSAWVWWLFAELLVPLLRSNFYVTESEAYKQEVFYYRKPVWARLQAAAQRELVRERMAPVSALTALQVLQRRDLGVARLRLLPKLTGMRPIINMGRPSRAVFPRMGHLVAGGAAPGPAPATGAQEMQTGAGRGRKRGTSSHVRGPTVRLSFKPTNMVLANTYQVLKAEVGARPELLACSVFGYDDILRRMHPFLRTWRRMQRAHPGLTPYIMTADVARAFDSIDISRLIDLALPILSAPTYHVARYQELTPSLGPALAKVRHQRVAVPLTQGTNGFMGMPAWLTSGATFSYNTVFADQLPHYTVERGVVEALLREALGRSVMRVRSRWYVQQRGIAQGAVTSMLLCSLYLAHVERTHLLPAIPSWQPHHHMLTPSLDVQLCPPRLPGTPATSSGAPGLTQVAAAAGSMRATATSLTTPGHGARFTRHSPGHSRGRSSGATGRTGGSRSALDTCPGNMHDTRITGGTAGFTPWHTQGGGVMHNPGTKAGGAGAGGQRDSPVAQGPSSMQVSPGQGAGIAGQQEHAEPSSMDTSPHEADRPSGSGGAGGMDGPRGGIGMLAAPSMDVGAGGAADMEWLPSATCHTPYLQLQLAQRPPDLAPTGALPQPTPSCWKVPRSCDTTTPGGPMWGPSIPPWPATSHTHLLAQRMPPDSPTPTHRADWLQLLVGGETRSHVDGSPAVPGLTPSAVPDAAPPAEPHVPHAQREAQLKQAFHSHAAHHLSDDAGETAAQPPSPTAALAGAGGAAPMSVTSELPVGTARLSASCVSDTAPQAAAWHASPRTDEAPCTVDQATAGGAGALTTQGGGPLAGRSLGRGGTRSTPNEPGMVAAAAAGGELCRSHNSLQLLPTLVMVAPAVECVVHQGSQAAGGGAVECGAATRGGEGPGQQPQLPVPLRLHTTPEVLLAHTQGSEAASLNMAPLPHGTEPHDTPGPCAHAHLPPAFPDPATMRPQRTQHTLTAAAQGTEHASQPPAMTRPVPGLHLLPLPQAVPVMPATSGAYVPLAQRECPTHQAPAPAPTSMQPPVGPRLTAPAPVGEVTTAGLGGGGGIEHAHVPTGREAACAPGGVDPVITAAHPAAPSLPAAVHGGEEVCHRSPAMGAAGSNLPHRSQPLSSLGTPAVGATPDEVPDATVTPAEAITPHLSNTSNSSADPFRLPLRPLGQPSVVPQHTVVAAAADIDLGPGAHNRGHEVCGLRQGVDHAHAAAPDQQALCVAGDRLRARGMEAAGHGTQGGGGSGIDVSAPELPSRGHSGVAGAEVEAEAARGPVCRQQDGPGVVADGGAAPGPAYTPLVLQPGLEQQVHGTSQHTGGSGSDCAAAAATTGSQGESPAPTRPLLLLSPSQCQVLSSMHDTAPDASLQPTTVLSSQSQSLATTQPLQPPTSPLAPTQALGSSGSDGRTQDAQPARRDGTASAALGGDMHTFSGAALNSEQQDPGAGAGVVGMVPEVEQGSRAVLGGCVLTGVAVHSQQPLRCTEALDACAPQLLAAELDQVQVQHEQAGTDVSTRRGTTHPPASTVTTHGPSVAPSQAAAQQGLSAHPVHAASVVPPGTHAAQAQQAEGLVQDPRACSGRRRRLLEKAAKASRAAQAGAAEEMAHVVRGPRTARGDGGGDGAAPQTAPVAGRSAARGVHGVGKHGLHRDGTVAGAGQLAHTRPPPPPPPRPAQQELLGDRPLAAPPPPPDARAPTQQGAAASCAATPLIVEAAAGAGPMHAPMLAFGPATAPRPSQPDSAAPSSRGARSARRAAAAAALAAQLPGRPLSLLMRLVDDFVLLTSSRASAEVVVGRMLAGFPEHGIAINPLKTHLSWEPHAIPLPPGADARSVPRVAVWRGKDGRPCVRWCGLLLGCEGLELGADYTRYRGTRVASAINVPLTSRPASFLAPRMAAYMRPKCHALLLDEGINSPLTARTNVYQAFLLCAMKAHAYMRTLARCGAGPGARGRGPLHDPRMLLAAIHATIAYTVRLMHNRTRAAAARLKLPLRCCIPPSHVRWLGLHAFLRVLGRKPAAYCKVLQVLREQHESPAMHRLARQLAPVVNRTRSSVFDEILY